MKKTLNLAHRGFSGLYPENSPAAFTAAMEIDGCDGFESDVHLTKDNQPVIIHDGILDRTTDGKGAVLDHSYNDLKKLDCGGWMDSKFAGQRIMHLEELLEFILEHDLVLNLEVKNYEMFYENIEEIVINTINKLNAANRVFLSSFNHFSMGICKEIDPKIEAGLLYNYPHLHPEFYSSHNGVNAVHPSFRSLYYRPAANMVNEVHAQKMKVHTWTVNEEDDMKKIIDLGVDSIITNFPDRLARLLNSSVRSGKIENKN